MRLRLIFLGLLTMSMFSCLDNIDRKPETTETIAESVSPFKYWTWITADPKRNDDSYAEEFKKYKDNGLDAILINTNLATQGSDKVTCGHTTSDNAIISYYQACNTMMMRFYRISAIAVTWTT